MAFIRYFGKLGSSSIKISLLNQNVRFISKSSALSTAIQQPKNQASSVPVTSQKVGRKDPLDTSFNDPLAAFKSKTTFELIRAYFVYMLCSSEYLVENNMKVSILIFLCHMMKKDFLLKFRLIHHDYFINCITFELPT